MTHWQLILLASGCAVAVLGCGADESQTEPPLPPIRCAIDEDLGADGTCEAPGVPRDGCSSGFEWLDGGCHAILPAGPCPSGTMALPGETACREVVPCGAPPFGEIPVEANTQFVDQSFTGVSNGTVSAPWVTIGQAFGSAAPGAIIAIAPGNYAERVALVKPVRLWGLCPGAVTVSGTPGEIDAIYVATAGAGSEIRNLAVTSPGVGIGVVASHALLEGLWVHDTANVGIVAEGFGNPTSVTLVGSLVENANGAGVRAAGATVEVGSSVIRGTVPSGSSVPGRGISLGQDAGSGAPSNGVVTGSVIEANTHDGIYVYASTLALADSVIRDTLLYQGDLGYGIAAVPSAAGAPALVDIQGSVLERNHGVGVNATGAQLVLDRTTVRDTLADSFASGYGVALQYEPNAAIRGNGTMTRSLLERNLEIGLFLWGADLALDSVAIRDTFVRATDGRGGRGISVEDAVTTEQRSFASLERVRIERSGAFGLIATGSDVVTHRLHVADTVGAQHPELVFGDGVAVFTVSSGLATVQLTRSQIERSARVGVSSFAANVGIAESTLECNLIQLTGETYNGTPSTFLDQGGNSCGCQGESEACKVMSHGVAPPTAL